jgi:hypothetical protein
VDNQLLSNGDNDTTLFYERDSIITYHIREKEKVFFGESEYLVFPTNGKVPYEENWTVYTKSKKEWHLFPNVEACEEFIRRDFLARGTTAYLLRKQHSKFEIIENKSFPHQQST